MRRFFFAILMLAAATATAQQLDLKSLDKFADKAKSKPPVAFSMASSISICVLLKDKKGDEGLAKKTTENMKGLFLRSYEFDRDMKDAYKLDDLKPILDQLKAPNWTPFLRNKENGELTEIWMHKTNNEIDGMLLVSAESNEVTVINVIGLTRPEDFSSLMNLSNLPIPKE